ncbi:hypothetical protein [Niastella vici]|uniref:hypothetical protein n=1 Tax=Niastella vici TaxID=1703345 RepID=UPI00118025FC|nr:hypothetical protein [Niastella vici]
MLIRGSVVAGGKKMSKIYNLKKDLANIKTDLYIFATQLRSRFKEYGNQRLSVTPKVIHSPIEIPLFTQ